jgi:hypothetical protein
MPTFSHEIIRTASQCRHYAMCKIDFLETGICPSAKGGNYVTYYPQGRMDVFRNLAKNNLQVTEALIDISDSCTLCGICDKQCHFVTELRPLSVMKELKNYIAEYKKAKNLVIKPEKTEFLIKLQEIVGDKWATNDPAHLVAYSDDPSPIAPPIIPRYVVLPKTKEEIQEIIKLCNKYKIEFNVRGNGSSVMGFVMSPGVVIDFNRMKNIVIDKDNWKVTVEPGVSAYELQREVHKHNLRVNVAEPSALVCANIMCSGIFSNFSHSYGTLADNYVDGEFIDMDGNLFRLNDINSPNLFSYKKEEAPLRWICVSLSVKLHPIVSDEEAILIPFDEFKKAIEFSRDLSYRRLGLALGILGGEYISTFISPTNEIAIKTKNIFYELLNIKYLVLVIGDKYSIEIVKKLGNNYIDNELLRILILGLPNLVSDEFEELIHGLKMNNDIYCILKDQRLYPIIKSALNSSPETVSKSVPDDLQDFYQKLYANDKFTNIIWLSSFRILSSRMGRKKHVVAFILYLPMDKSDLIESIDNDFRAIADKYGILNDFGFITPLDMGKRAVFEYDYYIDHTDDDEKNRCRAAIFEAAQMIEKYSAEYTGVKWIRYTLHQGCCRSESLLYT